MNAIRVWAICGLLSSLCIFLSITLKVPELFYVPGVLGIGANLFALVKGR